MHSLGIARTGCHAHENGCCEGSQDGRTQPLWFDDGRQIDLRALLRGAQPHASIFGEEFLSLLLKVAFRVPQKVSAHNLSAIHALQWRRSPRYLQV